MILCRNGRNVNHIGRTTDGARSSAIKIQPIDILKEHGEGWVRTITSSSKSVGEGVDVGPRYGRGVEERKVGGTIFGRDFFGMRRLYGSVTRPRE